MENLKYELKQHIIKELNLIDIKPDDIPNETPLFVDGLGLDSIDALELLVIMEKYYDIKVTNEKEGKAALYSINTMAAYVAQHRKK